MLRFRNISRLAALLVGAVALGAPNKAHATFQIFLQEAGVNGGNITMVASGVDFSLAGATFTGVYGDFTVQVFGSTSDNGINGGTLSDLLATTTAVTNNSGTEKTLKLWASQTGYTLPVGSPLRVESGLGGSVSQGTIGMSGIFQAFADKGNDLLTAGTLTGGAAVTDYTNGPQTGVPTGSTFDTGSASGAFSRDGTPYSLTSVATFDMSGGAKGNFSDHVNVTPVPAPAGLMLAASGVPALALGWLRRRKVKVQKS
jgi:hypothetical protein